MLAIVDKYRVEKIERVTVNQLLNMYWAIALNVYVLLEKFLAVYEKEDDLWMQKYKYRKSVVLFLKVLLTKKQFDNQLNFSLWNWIRRHHIQDHSIIWRKTPMWMSTCILFEWLESQLDNIIISNSRIID